MDAFSSVAGHATSPAWHTSMPSGGGIHPIKKLERAEAQRPSGVSIAVLDVVRYDLEDGL